MNPQPHPENPFKGLRPFEPKDKEKLFGRDRDLFLMKDRILSSRTTLLFAGSGVGKTSFLNAKIIPALQERYHVIWHNRWTGADESSGVENWDDRPPFKAWPPRAFWRWLVEVLRGFWRRRKTPESEVPSGHTASEGQSDDKLAAEVHRVIAQSLRGSGDSTGLAKVLSVFKKKPGSEAANQQHCVLILDQFEEVFQYHAFEEYFETFIASLCEIVNNNDYNVRIVFSMREEFLGELSVFDNRIPDLFSNYYRLRYPEVDEARDIIWQTCEEIAKTPVNKENLGLLVTDLSKIPKGFADHKHTVDNGAAETRFLRRNFVPPPYLQIVCDRLWKEQYETPAVPAATFLEHYRTGSDSGNGSESDAQRVVRIFCEEKLSAPFLNEREQDLVARAFGFLVTKQGAKMAYELNNLAYHMEERVWPLKNTLEKLSSPDVRILRESRGPERSYWYELYHDMYAGAIERWKRQYEKAKRKRTRVRFATYLSVIAALVLVVGSILYFKAANPAEKERILVSFRERLNTPEIQKAAGYSEALRAYSTLSNTLFYSGSANSLWAQVWHRRAQLYEANEKRDEALMSLLQAAALVKGEEAEEIYLTQANNLFARDDEAIKGTYCTECTIGRMSPDGKYVLAITNSGSVDIWTPLRSRVCDDCKDALFSADSSMVTAVTPIIEEAPREAPKNERRRNEPTNQRRPNERSTGDQQAQLATTASVVIARRSPDVEPSSSESPRGDTAGERTQANRESGTTSASSQTDTQALATATPTPIPRTVGWRVKLFQIRPPSETYLSTSFDVRATQPIANQNAVGRTAAPPFRLKAVSKLLLGNLVAGVLNNELVVWRDNGQVLPIKSGQTKFELASDAARLAASFSRDGRFFAAGGPPRHAIQLWEVKPEGLVLSAKITKLAPGPHFVFSPDGRYFLAATEERNVKLWDLSSQSEVLNIDLTGKQLTRVGFGLNSGKFFVAQRDGTVTVWDSDSRQQVFQPLTLKASGTTMLLDSEGKTIVRRVGATTTPLYDKWSFETGKKVSEVKVRGVIRANYLDEDGSLVLAVGSEVRRWELLPPKTYETFQESPEDNSSFDELSSDGETMLMVDDKSWNEQASVFRLWNISTRSIILSITSEHSGYFMSPDALRLAVILQNDKTLKVFDRTRPDTPELTFADEISRVAFNPTGKIMAVATGNKEVHLVDTSSYSTVKTFRSEVEINSLTFGPNGQFLSIQSEGPLPLEWAELFETPTKTTAPLLEVWSVATSEKVPLKLSFKDALDAVDLSSDNRILFAQNKRIFIHRLNDGQLASEFSYDKDLALAKFTPDGKFVITCDDKGELQLWNVDSGQAGPPLSLGRKVTEIVFSSDGTSFIAATTSWMHRIAIVGNALRYSEGILSGPFESSTVRLLQASDPNTGARTPYLRWIFETFYGVQAENASFDGKMSRQVLQGGADKLFEYWEARLGLNISSLGYLSRDLVTAPPIAAPSPSPPI